jgi:hypothetical protein
MPILMKYLKNPTPEVNSVKVSCQKGYVHFWETGQEQWVWTERINNGCSAIVFLSTQACFLYHVGQLPPDRYPLWEEVGSASRIEDAWTTHYTTNIINYFRQYKSQLQDRGNSRLYIVAPRTQVSETNGQLRISDSIAKMRRDLTNETQITPKTIEYTPMKVADLKEDSRNWVVVEARSLESGGTELYVNRVYQGAA